MADSIIPESMQRVYDNFHFAPGTKHEGVLYCSGQIGIDANGQVPESMEEEFRNAWTMIGVILNEASMSFENIIEYTSYHVGLQSHMGEFMAVRDEFVKAPYPAWTAIGITELAVPGARVEIRVRAG